MSSIQFDNFETIEPAPYTVHVVRTFNDGEYAYFAELMLHLGAEPKTAVFLPTRIEEPTAERAATLALTHVMSLFGPVSVLVLVIDSETGEMIEELDLRELAGPTAQFAMDAMPPADGTTIH